MDPETPPLRCAPAAEQRHDQLFATAPPASRWLLIENRAAWPRQALDALQTDGSKIAQLCAAEGIRPVLIRRHGRQNSAAPPRQDPAAPDLDLAAPDLDPAAPGRAPAAPTRGPAASTGQASAASRHGLAASSGQSSAAFSRQDPAAPSHQSPAASAGRRSAAQSRQDSAALARLDSGSPRRWALVDSRPGRESVRWGDLPTDDHLLNVLAGTDPGTPSTDPIYLVCTHGRHDTCCAVRGRPAAAALTAAFPDRTWECSHIGGDRFAANLVFLPHSLFYGHVPTPMAVPLATQYTEGFLVPEYLRGSGAHPPPVQAAQHFARAAGAPSTLDGPLPTQVTRPTPTTWQIHLATSTHTYAVTLTATPTTVQAQLTCAARPPGHLTTYTLNSLETMPTTH